MSKKKKERFSWRSCCEGRRNVEKLEVGGLGFPSNVDFVSGSNPAADCSAPGSGRRRDPGKVERLTLDYNLRSHRIKDLKTTGTECDSRLNGRWRYLIAIRARGTVVCM